MIYFALFSLTYVIISIDFAYSIINFTAMLDNMPVLLADEEKLTSSPMEQSSSSNDDR